MHATAQGSELDPALAPRARFAAKRSALREGCGVLFLAFWAVGFFGGASYGLVGPSGPVFAATVVAVALVFWFDRRRSLKGRPTVEVRVYDDAVGFTRDGGPWELVRLDEIAEAFVSAESLELVLTLRGGRTASLPLVWLSLADRKALAAELRALVPGGVRGLDDAALKRFARPI